MSKSSEGRLFKLGEAVSDGSSVDWDAELTDTPGLASELKRLQQLEAIGRVHRSIVPAAADVREPSPSRPSSAPVSLPFDWGPLRIVEYVGEGSFGVVYRAIDTRLQCEVALKLRRMEAGGSETSARRFLDEARTLARIRHPNVVVVHGADVRDGRVGFWTDFLRGKNLAAHLSEKGPLSADEVAAVGLDLCRALGAVHAAGMVHGDVKASNAIREDTGKVMLMDFGAASWLAYEDGERGSHDERVSDRGDAGVVFGTPLTMAPEVLAGKASIPASDLYSLGVLLYELASGRYPCEAGSITELREKLERGEWTPLSELRPAFPQALVEVIERTLNHDPELRYASAAEMERALVAATGGPPPKRHALPAEADSFIGREAELAELAERFNKGARLVTLLGMGGLGKTRLAVRWGWQELASWPGGVWFCDLTEARIHDGIVAAVATALEARLERGDATTEQLGHAIAGRKRCLVILDNCEQVVGPAAAVVGDWLEQAPDARFLVTSRERLNVRGESVQVVEPLSSESGVALFIERAQRHRPSFALDRSDESLFATIREVVDLLEAIPLAIELAAARMRVITPLQLLERMRERFRLLAGGREGRHATLRVAIDGSWDLLRTWERSAFAQCSVFQGGFTLEAAENVLDLSPFPDAPWILDVVQSLVDKSLLRTWVPDMGGNGGTQEARFGMYVSLQEYARMRLRAEEIAEGERSPALESAVEERHAKWYARYGTEESIAALDQREGAGRRRALARELENLVTACRWASRSGDGSTAVAACRAAWAVLELSGPFGLAVDLAREVLDASKLKHEEKLEILRVLGQAEKAAGSVEAARAHVEAALALSREVGSRRLEGIFLANLAGLLADQGRAEEAQAKYDDALAIHREVGNRRFEGMALGNLGIMALHQGRMKEARGYFQGALAIAREVGNRRSEGTTLGNLGNLYNGLGLMEEARACYEEALAIAREVGNRQGEAIVHGGLANLYQDQGRMEEARRHYESSLALNRESGHRRSEGITLGNLALLELRQGWLAEARCHFEEALAVHRRIGNRRFEGIVLGQLGILHDEQGSTEEARAHFEAALAIHKELDNHRFEGLVLGSLGSLLLRQGRIAEAADALTRGERILREVGDHLALATLLCERVELELGNGNEPAARAVFLEADSLTTEVGAGNDSELGSRLAELRQKLSG